VQELARRLDEVESRYAQLRGMLGGSVTLPESQTRSGEAKSEGERLYVAPPMVANAPAVADSAAAPGPSIPARWPLSVGSYRTRGLAVDDPRLEAHSGLDLAVPVGSDVRATGGGQITETATDSAYGLFVRINHGSGYESMYGHLSRVIVARGDAVRAGQVIGLSGNTGRSTAPHLHFEIKRYGRSVDPTTLVREGT
jgi:murein DD-endopeptidase MepM/ murein hydrolase activator NlpD